MAAGSFVKPAQPLDVSGSMAFSGARRVGVLAFAKTTEIVINGTWASPSFDGSLPARVAQASPVRNRATVAHPPAVSTARLGGSLHRPRTSAPEQLRHARQTRRGGSRRDLRRGPPTPTSRIGCSLKYALLFVGLVFLASLRVRDHHGQRVHLGAVCADRASRRSSSTCSLLSISEHVGFDYGFLIAAGATVGLISASMRDGCSRAGCRACARSPASRCSTALIYVLMRLEGYALLVGALSSFIAIALVMYFTRRVDWYGAYPAHLRRFRARVFRGTRLQSRSLSPSRVTPP